MGSWQRQEEEEGRMIRWQCRGRASVHVKQLWSRGVLTGGVGIGSGSGSGSSTVRLPDSKFIEAAISAKVLKLHIEQVYTIYKDVLTTSYARTDQWVPVIQSLSSLQPHSCSDLYMLGRILRQRSKSGDEEARQFMLAAFFYSAWVKGHDTALKDLAAVVFVVQGSNNSMATGLKSFQTAIMGDMARVASDKALDGNRRSIAMIVMAQICNGLERYSQAEALYQQAGALGNGDAWYELGNLARGRRNGGGHEDDARRAYEKGAALGSADASFMAAAYAANPGDKERYLMRAAAAGSPKAAHNLGDMYRVRGDMILAIEWFTVAATAGFAISQVNLVHLMMQMDPAPSLKRKAEMVRWLEAAEESGGEVGQDAFALRQALELTS